MAFLWALLCGCIIYLFLVGIGETHAFSIVITLLCFAAIWLFIRLRGEDRPGL